MQIIKNIERVKEILMTARILRIYRRNGLLNEDGTVRTMEEQRRILGIIDTFVTLEDLLRKEETTDNQDKPQK